MADSTSSDYFTGKMRGVQKQLKGFGVGNQEGMRQDLMAKVDAFAPQWQELAGLESAAYSAPARQLASYQNRYPVGQAGPGALTMLNSTLGNVGQQMGTANALQNIINTQGGRIDNMAKMAFDQTNAERQALQQQYDMFGPLQQQAAAREEAARQRAFQAKEAAKSRAAAASSGGRGGASAQDLMAMLRPQGNISQNQIRQPSSNPFNRAINNIQSNVSSNVRRGLSGALDKYR